MAYVPKYRTHAETRRQRAAGSLTCRGCRRSLPLSAYHTGRRATCRECKSRKRSCKDCKELLPRGSNRIRCLKCHENGKKERHRQSAKAYKERKHRIDREYRKQRKKDLEIYRKIKEEWEKIEKTVLSCLKLVTRRTCKRKNCQQPVSGKPGLAGICRKHAAARQRDRKHRIRSKSRYVERVDLDEIYSKHRETCWICLKHVQREEASIDHIRPISRKGKHANWNVKLAHRICNGKRSDKPPLVYLAEIGCQSAQDRSGS